MSSTRGRRGPRAQDEGKDGPSRKVNSGVVWTAPAVGPKGCIERQTGRRQRLGLRQAEAGGRGQRTEVLELDELPRVEPSFQVRLIRKPLDEELL